MNIMRSKAQPELVHAFFTNSEASSLCLVLRKEKSPHGKELRRRLKKVLK